MEIMAVLAVGLMAQTQSLVEEALAEMVVLVILQKLAEPLQEAI
jgi:hypothetical protein